MDVRTHNGFITIENPATGNHRTFRISTQPDDARFAPGMRIVSLLTGPDRDCFENWQPFAFAYDDGIVLWRSKRGNGKRSQWEIFCRMLNHPDHFEAKGAVYLFEGRCRKCNRELSNPESVREGIGPICSGRV